MDISNVLIVVVFLVYSIFGIRWGLQYVEGRWETLEQPNMKVFKIIVAVVIGVCFGYIKMAVLLCKLVLKVVSFITKGW